MTGKAATAKMGTNDIHMFLNSVFAFLVTIYFLDTHHHTLASSLARNASWRGIYTIPASTTPPSPPSLGTRDGGEFYS